LTYDAAGNLTGDGQSTWVYNDRGRMASATKGTTTATYTHDSFGQRVRKTGPTSIVTTGTNFFVYDEAGKLLGEYNSTGGVIQEYVYLNEELVAIVRGTTASPQVFYVYTDQVGRPWTVTDTANQLRWQWDTSPFGEFSPNQNPAGLGTFTFRLRFPGQYLDQETGLFYNYFRDYDPQTGRYVQADPIGQRGGVNVYTYANLNPLLRSDRLGLLPGEIPEEPFVPADPSFCPCPPVPQAPPGVSCNANIAQSQGKGPIWVYQQSRNSGPFDYKQQGQQYEAFGNFNFGAIAAAAGLAAGTIQRGAGAAQMMAGTSLPQWGQPFGAPPYGDDPTDQEFINQGILYYICGCIK
jgi:RHS repeat-associated protein